jgi:hypothetical protein
MSQDIESQIENRISEGERLLEEYESSKSTLTSTTSKAGDSALAALTGLFVGDIVGNGRTGGTVRRHSREYLNEQRKKQLQELTRQTERRVDTCMTQVIGLLERVSILTTKKKPNSQRLVSKFSGITRFTKPETRLVHGISILKGFKLEDLVWNDDLKAETKKGLVAGPDQEFEAYQKVLEIIKSASGFIKIIDAYASEVTLIAINHSPNGLSLQFLTYPPKDRDSFETSAKKLMKDRPEIQIQYAPKQSLHDRFIITGDSFWHLGHSIKDIGNKLSAISLMSPDEGNIALQKFNQLWNTSQKIAEVEVRR